MKVYILTLFLLLTFISCSQKSEQFHSNKLRYIGEKNYTTQTRFKGILFGGLSGVTFDNSSKKLIVISDDRSVKGPARFYTFKLELTENKFDVTPLDFTVIKTKKNKTHKEMSIDPEGITILKNGNILVSTEGDSDRKPRIRPKLIEYKRDGTYIRNWPVPKKFKQEKKKKQTKGVRDNKGFESLTATPNKEYIFTTTEDALLQDGPKTNFEKGSSIRILRYKYSQGKIEKPDEFMYVVDPVPNPQNFENPKGSSGVADMVALDKNTLLILERSFLFNSRRNSIRIYKVRIEKNSANVSSLNSLKDKRPITLNKEPFFNLEQIRPLLNKDFAKLENMEGICLGPALKNGNQTLILVSDNNFYDKQFTKFFAFEITR